MKCKRWQTDPVEMDPSSSAPQPSFYVWTIHGRDLDEVQTMTSGDLLSSPTPVETDPSTSRPSSSVSQRSHCHWSPQQPIARDDFATHLLPLPPPPRPPWNTLAKLPLTRPFPTPVPIVCLWHPCQPAKPLAAPLVCVSSWPPCTGEQQLTLTKHTQLEVEEGRASTEHSTSTLLLVQQLNCLCFLLHRIYTALGLMRNSPTTALLVHLQL